MRDLMKPAIAIVALAAPAHAQQADPATIAAQRAAIAKLDAMNGLWRGEAVTRSPQGELRLVQTERVGNALDGTIKVVEGTGYNADGSVAFQAFAVISFDVPSGRYLMRSWAQGFTGEFEVKPTARGFTWERTAGPATIRYEATLADGRWVETGDYVAPGRPSFRFVEMNLARIGDTAWPRDGRVGPR